MNNFATKILIKSFFRIIIIRSIDVLKTKQKLDSLPLNIHQVKAYEKLYCARGSFSKQA